MKIRNIKLRMTVHKMFDLGMLETLVENIIEDELCSEDEPAFELMGFPEAEELPVKKSGKIGKPVVVKFDVSFMSDMPDKRVKQIVTKLFESDPPDDESPDDDGKSQYFILKSVTIG
jgi:hypothetical protein